MILLEQEHEKPIGYGQETHSTHRYTLSASTAKREFGQSESHEVIALLES